MDPSALLGFAAVSFVIVAVPGPSVLFAVSRAIAVGRRSALLTVLGNTCGLFGQVLLVALGLGLIVTGSPWAYSILLGAGAAYLVWLGVGTIRHRHEAARALGQASLGSSAAPWRDGFVVGLTNPKSIVFLAALLPQHADPARGAVGVQMLGLGALFCTMALVGDSAWALLASRARTWIATDRRRLSWASVAGGLVLVALGVGLLLG